MAVLYAHLEDGPPSVVERRAELPQEVDTVLARALAKAPEERYDSCLDLVDAARNALGLARPKRSRRRLAAVLVVIGLLLIGAGVASYFALSGGEAKPRHDTLVRIDPAKNAVANSYSVGPQATSVATGDGYVWATSFEAPEDAVAGRPGNGCGSRHENTGRYPARRRQATSVSR